MSSSVCSDAESDVGNHARNYLLLFSKECFFFFFFFSLLFSGVWFLGVCFVSLNRGLKQANPTSAGGNDFLIIFLPFHPAECDLPALAVEL